MIDHLSINNILEIYIFLLANPFDVKTERFSISIFTPTFLKKSFLHCWVAPEADKYTLFGLNSSLFLPKCKIRYILKGLFHHLAFWNFRNLLLIRLNMFLILCFFLWLLIGSSSSWSIFDLRKLKILKMNFRSTSFISPFSSVRNFSLWYFWLILAWLFWYFYKFLWNYWISLH